MSDIDAKPTRRARAFNAEAARRGLAVNQLFAELWQTYQQNQSQGTG